MEAQTILRLKKENKINDDFLSRLSLLTFEELISCKLEMTANLLNGKLYGFPLKAIMTNILKESLLNIAEQHLPTLTERSSFLGLTSRTYIQFKKQIEARHNEQEKMFETLKKKA